MICERCNEKSATVHLMRVEQKKRREYHLCEICAEEEGVSSVQGTFSLKSFLEDVGAAPAVSGVAPCAHCGLTYEAFRVSGRLGCADCYEHFREQLLPLLEKIHESTQHVGKAPTKLETRREKREVIDGLRREQERAIKDENYERAGELRDRIQALEAELESPGD